MYYESCPHCLVEAINEFPVITLAKANDVYKTVVKDIKGDFADPLHPELYELYKNNYHKAVRSVFGQPEYGSRYFEHAAKFELNTARFAAYKSHYATQTLIKSFEAAPEKFAMNSGKILKQFARWQATEYNTTVARCRTAKQFEQFQSEAHLYPNLEWLATRSATPRELHLSFVGIVLPMDDPFWNENQPGNLYNCKCDWKTTDAPVTGSPTKVVKPHPGLEGNPAKTGDVFTDNHTYFKKTNPGTDTLSDIVYFDLKANFPISVIADKTEIADNIATARILIDNFPEMKIAIRENIIYDGIKNPEFWINGMLADAKRIEGYKGITWGFKSAIKQNCHVVIIDFNKHFTTSKPFDIDVAHRRIKGRFRDFENDIIKECYIIYGSKVAIITKHQLTEKKLINLLKAVQPK